MAEKDTSFLKLHIRGQRSEVRSQKSEDSEDGKLRNLEDWRVK